MKSSQKESDAFLLHATKFKETSLLCNFFSKEFGKVSAVAKGARSKKSKFQVLTVPGAIFKISFSPSSLLLAYSDSVASLTPNADK